MQRLSLQGLGGRDIMGAKSRHGRRRGNMPSAKLLRPQLSADAGEPSTLGPPRVCHGCMIMCFAAHNRWSGHKASTLSVPA